MIALLVLRGTDIITSDVWVAAGGIWLIGGGCLGSPIPALRITPHASMVLGCSTGACAALVSGLMLVGRMHPDTLVAFSLVALVAFAIHAINGCGTTLRDRGQRAQIEQQRLQIAWLEGYVEQIGQAQRAKGRNEGRIEGLEIAHEEQMRRIEAMKSIGDVPLETVQAWYLAVVSEMRTLDPPRPRVLHAVPDVAPTEPGNVDGMETTQNLVPRRGYRLARSESASAVRRAMQPAGTSRRVPGP